MSMRFLCHALNPFSCSTSCSHIGASKSRIGFWEVPYYTYNRIIYPQNPILIIQAPILASSPVWIPDCGARWERSDFHIKSSGSLHDHAAWKECAVLEELNKLPLSSIFKTITFCWFVQEVRSHSRIKKRTQKHLQKSLDL